MQLDFPSADLDLSVPRVMGILNVTPDSFSDGGLYALQRAAVQHALDMVAEGADIIDIGGESTRPGAEPVSAAEELDRVVGVIEGLRAASAVPVSIDTSKPEVMRAAVAAGASMVNDVSALRATGALEAVAELGVPVCLMHMQGEPRSMQQQPQYGDVVEEVLGFLCDRVAACTEAGILQQRIVLDPGFGFGKTLQHNLELLQALGIFADMGHAVVAGLSRKSMIPALMENAGLSLPSSAFAILTPERNAAMARDRLGGSVTLALYAVAKGAHIVRVHDVRETVEALTIQRSLSEAEKTKE
jgi:dihydropteroate synthase